MSQPNWAVQGEKTVAFVPQVLALPGFVWKQLSGEEVSWSKDFPAVDSVLVSWGLEPVVPRCSPHSCCSPRLS